ncbi:hypothetical protein CON36_34970 [Bacillus cereus]|uniref:Uncharacterized protein n=2 Tax=Bacillus cereus group TaxID=86661 RepID=A0A9X6WIY8_BACTU|nr:MULTISPECIES: hypothetical protein [Bacillus cereus group]PDZ94217.1 hypothetical protein CON36_34970 [Bacillus cereus]PFJ33144.1 hypothetical protein COJ15_28285 [Bacillus thuringiensis]
MLDKFQTGSINKLQICDEVFHGLAQQWRDRVEIKRHDQHWFSTGGFLRHGYQNTETIIVEKRPKYVR